MKRIAILLMTLVLFVFVGHAQPSKRTSAYNYLKYGELGKARDAIEKACKHPKTIHDPRTWLYKGLIYQSIRTSKEYKNLEPYAADTAFAAYKKALLYNIKDESIHNLDIENNYLDFIKFQKKLMDPKTSFVDRTIFSKVLVQFPALANSLVNQGVAQYQSKQYEKAYHSFSNSLFTSSLVNKIDTPVIYYSALAASKCGKTDEAVKSFKMLRKLKYGKTDKERAGVDFLLAKVYLDKKDTANYLKTLKEGIDAYPNDNSSLVVELINHYLQTGKTDQALNYLNVALKKDSTNAGLFYARGSLYDTKLNKPDKAILDYEKAIALDSTNFDANYNLGALYYNNAVETIKKAQDETDNDKYNKMVKQAKSVMQQALPFLERAHRLNPTDKNTMISLKEIYYRLGKLEKSKEMKKALGM